MSPFPFLSPALVLVSIGAAVFVVWILRRQRARVPLAVPGRGLPVSVGGVVEVPILGLMLRGLGSKSMNSINPTLALTAEGLEFKVFRRTSWAYGELTGVDAGWAPMGPTLDFKRPRAYLHVTFRDRATACLVLEALPRSVRLSEKAAALRDEGAGSPRAP